MNSFLDAQGTPGELNAEAYQPALLTMVALLVIGFIANLMVRPVDSKHHEPDKQQKARGADSGGNAGKPDTTKLEEDHK